LATIVRSDDLRRHNQRRILGALRRHGAMSRTDLAAATGLSASTVTAITAGLVEAAALIDTPGADAAATRRGRPQVLLGLNPVAASVGAVSLSLNRVSAAIVDYAGEVVAETVSRVPTRETARAGLSAAMTGALKAARAACDRPVGPLRRIAIAVQGVTDSAGTTMLWSPITAETDLDVAVGFEHAFSVPAAVANDCNMIARALRWREPERFGDSFAAVLLSHGIGMGLYLNGELVGGIGSSATEFGHMTARPGGALCRCGRRGCIEAYAGDYAIWRAAHSLDPASQPVEDLDAETMKGVADRARRGDGPERRAYRAAGEAIGAGLRSMFALFDPFPVAFVGSGAAVFDVLERPIRDTIGESAIGMSTSRVAMHCFPDEFPLVRDGATISALNWLDDNLFAAAAPGSARRPDLRHAV